MANPSRRSLVAALASAVALLLATHPASADDDHDGDSDEHEDRASAAIAEAVRLGEVKSLVEVLEAIRPDIAGEVVGVEVERKNGLWIYEIRVVGADGRVREVYIDAASARVIKTEEK